MSDVLYDETQGIVDFAIKLFTFAQERAIETGRERINAGVIRKAAKDKLKIPRRVLRALETKDMRVLEQFEDLYPSAMKDYLSAQEAEPQLSGKIASSPEIEAILEDYRWREAHDSQAPGEGQGNEGAKRADDSAAAGSVAN